MTKKNKNHERSPDKVQTSIAIPKRLLTAIEKIANKETRNRNNTIQWLLEQAVAEWQSPYNAKQSIATIQEDESNNKNDTH